MPNKPKYAVMHSSKSWEWRTPQKVYETLDAEFHFDFDPCPLGGSDDGRSTLFTSWEGKRAFVNSPYGSQIPKFLERAREADVAVFLLPVRACTRWFHMIVLPQAKEIRFVRGRLRFGESTNSAPFSSMVVIFEAGFIGPPAISSFNPKEKL